MQKLKVWIVRSKYLSFDKVHLFRTEPKARAYAQGQKDALKAWEIKGTVTVSSRIDEYK